MVLFRFILKLVGYVGVYVGPLLILIALSVPRQTDETRYFWQLGCVLIVGGVALVWFGRKSLFSHGIRPHACTNCLAPIATKPLSFRQVIGMLVAWQRQSVSGFFCRNCAREYFWHKTGMTLLLGWLGASIILLPFTLVENVVNYLDALSLPLREEEDDGELTRPERRALNQVAASNASLRDWKARYRVMAYHDSSGVYKLGAAGTTLQIMVPHDDLKLPPELRDRLNQWIRLYAKRTTNPDEYATMGRNLARELKRVLGPDVYVEFRGESADGLHQPPEPIES